MITFSDDKGSFMKLLPWILWY